MDENAAGPRIPKNLSPAGENPNVEFARRSMEAALEALRELEVAHHSAERLARQALDSLRSLTSPEGDHEGAFHESPFLSITETAEILGVPRKRAWRMVKDGTLPSCRLGQRVVVARNELKKWEESLSGQGLG